MNTNVTVRFYESPSWLTSYVGLGSERFFIHSTYHKKDFEMKQEYSYYFTVEIDFPRGAVYRYCMRTENSEKWYDLDLRYCSGYVSASTYSSPVFLSTPSEKKQKPLNLRNLQLNCYLNSTLQALAASGISFSCCTSKAGFKLHQFFSEQTSQSNMMRYFSELLGRDLKQANDSKRLFTDIFNILVREEKSEFTDQFMISSSRRSFCPICFMTDNAKARNTYFINLGDYGDSLLSKKFVAGTTTRTASFTCKCKVQNASDYEDVETSAQTQRIVHTKLPKVLFILNNGEKPVNFENETFTLVDAAACKEVHYKLAAVVWTTHGHSVATVLYDQQWHYCDDNVVKAVRSSSDINVAALPVIAVFRQINA